MGRKLNINDIISGKKCCDGSLVTALRNFELKKKYNIDLELKNKYSEKPVFHVEWNGSAKTSLLRILIIIFLIAFTTATFICRKSMEIKKNAALKAKEKAEKKFRRRTFFMRKTK